MVIFHSYVKLPEGIRNVWKPRGHRCTAWRAKGQAVAPLRAVFGNVPGDGHGTGWDACGDLSGELYYGNPIINHSIN